MRIERVSPLDWNKYGMQKAYESSFGQSRDAGLERFAFALVAVDDDNDPVGFITCHELDSETVYWQIGGAFDKVKNTYSVITYYLGFITYCRGRFKRIRTRIENTNLRMLKLALKCGFLIVGTLTFNNTTYLELVHG